jgi:non-homologous end joining protein Ku
MDPTTPENTFAYNITREKVPGEAQFIWDINHIDGEGNMSEKLSELGNTAYEALETVQKVEVAKLFILNRPDEGFADIAAIETALGTAINQYNNLLGAVNAADTVDSMKTALEAIGELFGINVTDLMAQAALDAKGDGYESVSAIIAVIQSDVAKAAFLNYLKDKVEDIEVADVEIVGEDITVTFDRDTTPSAVYQAANELVDALKGELEAATLTLNEDETDGRFDLTDEDVAAQIALYLLEGTSPQDFLKGKEAVEASYTVEATNQDGVTFTLEGELVFAVAAPSDEEIREAKEAFLNYLKDKVEDIEVADVEIVGEDITVTFDRDTTPSAVYQAANELVDALKGELEAATLTLNEDETDGRFDLTDEDVAAQIALYLLEGTSPQDFLKGKEAVEASYTVEATNQDGVTFTLEGELVFAVAAPSDEEIREAKEAFLNYLKDKVEDIEVADVEIVGEDITVTFDRDTTPSAVYQAANELVDALKGELEAATLTLNEDETDGRFDLTDEDVAAQIALYLLEGTSPQDFLKGKEAVEASYTVEATNQDGVTFTLEGELVFAVAAPSDEEIREAKEAFLNYLKDKVEDIEVADVEIVGEDITVTFDRDTTPSAVYQAANELVDALKGELEAATLTLNEDETDGRFDLTDEDVAAQIALYLLEGTSPAEFLKGLETIEAIYTVEAIDQDGIPFTLEGGLVFQVAAPSDDEIAAAKAAFLAYLEDRVKDIDVADVVIDIDEDGENITVTFDRDAKPTDVLQTANELVAALKGELYSATLILNNDETDGRFDLTDEDVAAQIALYLLEGTSPQDFLKGKEAVEASYTVEATNQDGVTFTLEGELVFAVAAPSDEEIREAKEAFLNYLKDKVEDIEVADVEIVGEDITVTFDRDTTPSAVYQAANELVDALKGELEAATLTLNEDETDGRFDLTDEDVAAQIALYLLEGTSPQDFLKGKEAVEASYTVEATNQDGITFTLEGELVFAVAAPSDEEIREAKEAFLNYLKDKVEDIEVADVEIDGEDITVTFDRDTTPSAVYQAANELVDALKGELEAATLTLNEDETDGRFDLTDEDVAAQIALYLLEGTSPQSS